MSAECKQKMTATLSKWKETIDEIIKDADSFSLEDLHARLKGLREEISQVQADIGSRGELG